MPAMKLTALNVPTLMQGEWWDTILSGLILRVGRKRRTWCLRVRMNGKNRRDVLGHFPRLSLGDARERARGLLAQFDRAAPAPAPVPHPRAVLTLGALLERFEKARAREGHRIKSLPAMIRLLRNGLRPYLDMPANDFSKADARAVRDTLAERGLTRQPSKFVSSLSVMLQWAAHEDLIENNVALAIRKTPAVKRDRVLTRDELVQIWNAAGALGGYGSCASLRSSDGAQRQRRSGTARVSIMSGDRAQVATSQDVRTLCRSHLLPWSSSGRVRHGISFSARREGAGSLPSRVTRQRSTQGQAYRTGDCTIFVAAPRPTCRNSGSVLISSPQSSIMPCPGSVRSTCEANWRLPRRLRSPPGLSRSLASSRQQTRERSRKG